ncbi:hypothetical protein ACWV95_01425 [Streptomyces albus]
MRTVSSSARRRSCSRAGMMRSRIPSEARKLSWGPSNSSSACLRRADAWYIRRRSRASAVMCAGDSSALSTSVGTSAASTQSTSGRTWATSARS